jgi:hypothetical protein
MGYWFTDPMIKGILPLAASTSIRGISNTFRTPKIFMGPNVFPEGPAIGATATDHFAARCPKKRAFVVTDRTAERWARRVAAAMEAKGFVTQTWNNAQPEAPVENVREAAGAMGEFEPDLVVAVGGGSVMDGAKAAWMLYERPDITDIGMVSPLAPLGLRRKAIMAAVPTTSGTGSECTSVAVVHDVEAARKIPLAHDELLPDYAVLVPEFTVSMPPWLTAGTGLDALAHAVDAVCVVSAYEFTDALALEAIRMIFKYLPRAYRNGRDREARYRMLMAASMAGIAFGHHSCALSHSLGHSLGGLFHKHHGLSVGIFLPYTLQYYSQISDKYLAICKALDVEGRSRQESLSNLVSRMRGLFGQIDVPLNLKDLGVPEDDFEKNMEKLVLYACEDIDTFFSPRPMTPQECERLFRYAYEGRDVDF